MVNFELRLDGKVVAKLDIDEGLLARLLKAEPSGARSKPPRPKPPKARR